MYSFYKQSKCLLFAIDNSLKDIIECSKKIKKTSFNLSTTTPHLVPLFDFVKFYMTSLAEKLENLDKEIEDRIVVTK